jgi:hypothetical protein
MAAWANPGEIVLFDTPTISADIKIKSAYEERVMASLAPELSSSVDPAASCRFFSTGCCTLPWKIGTELLRARGLVF